MAATSFDPRNPRIIPNNGGLPRILKAGLEASTQSFYAGEFVSVDASADVTVSATGASTAVYGIAMADAAGSTSTAVYVQKIEQSDDIIMFITDASGSGAAYTNCVVGEDYDLLVTSHLHSVNYADTTNPAFVFVQGIDDAAGNATQYGRFRVLSSVLDDGVTAS
jgi:hypothetical protein